MTKVPQAPAYVLGIMNLRGRIVSNIDLGLKLGLAPSKTTETSRIIIVNSRDENIGLLVDRITDVVTSKWRGVESNPSNIKEVKGTAGLFSGNPQVPQGSHRATGYRGSLNAD
ncbi:chemotaxis protein CheW [Desulfomicrobium norvegicum]|nr:chemotaxis protein CheW [Desulfomicrobium norvegicum]